LIIFFKKKKNLIFSYKTNFKLNNYVINYFKLKNKLSPYQIKHVNLDNKIFINSKNTNDNFYKLLNSKNTNINLKLNAKFNFLNKNHFRKLLNSKNTNINLKLNAKFNFLNKNHLVFKSFFFKNKALMYNQISFKKKNHFFKKKLKIEHFNTYFNTYFNNTYFVFLYIFNLKHFSSALFYKFKFNKSLNSFFLKFNLEGVSQTNLYPNFNFNYFFFKKINTFFNKKYINLGFTP